MKQLLLLCTFIIIFVGVCNAQCGTITAPSGVKFNLDPLTSNTDYVGTESGTTFRYYYNYCKNIVSQLSCASPAPVAQISQTGACTIVGYLPPEISLILNGVKIVYTNNNDLCGNPRTIPRISTFALTCAPDVNYSLVHIEEPGVCQYLFSVQTKYACPVTNPTHAPTPGPTQDCCEGGSQPGCRESAIQTCVCSKVQTCCTSAWNRTCVDLVESLGCGDCSLKSCCDAHKEKSCEDRQVSRCVCEKMDSCCTTAWTDECVSAVNNFGCGTCQGACCGTPTCDDAKVRKCVCNYDTYCCNVKWDASCAAEVSKYNCSQCISLPLESSLTPLATGKEDRNV